MSSNQERNINIYCDESRHTSDPSDAFIVIGAILCPRQGKRDIVHRINCLKAKHRAQGEFGWKRLSPNRKNFYWDLLKLFSDSPLAFRCLTVDRNILDHETYNEGDAELGFYKLYYQMLVHWLKPGCCHYIYLDWQQNKAQTRFSDLHGALAKKLSGRAKVACLEPVSSHQQPLVQLADLFIGAVGYYWNERHLADNASKVKVEFCEALAQAIGLSDLRASTFPIKDKFSLFHFTGSQRDG